MSSLSTIRSLRARKELIHGTYVVEDFTGRAVNPEKDGPYRNLKRMSDIEDDNESHLASPKIKRARAAGTGGSDINSAPAPPNTLRRLAAEDLECGPKPKEDSRGVVMWSLHVKARGMPAEQFRITKQEHSLPWALWYMEYIRMNRQERKQHNHVFENFANDKKKKMVGL